MPLRNLYCLSDSAAVAGGQQRNRSGWMKPLWVVPRAWCVTASLQAKGVPRHKTAAFIRLHLARLAPFVDSGVYACRTGDWVHLWFWENQRVRDFCETHQMDFAALDLAPESVCLPKISDGAVLHRCIEGVEAQLWHKGALLDSAWWPKQIDGSDWQAWRPTAAAAGSGRAKPAAWPESLPPMAISSPHPGRQPSAHLLKPWASNVLGEKWWRGFKEIRSGLFFTLSGSVLLGFTGYLSAQWLYVQQELNRVDLEISALSSRVEPVLTARGKTRAYLQWTSQVAKLNQQVGIGDTLHVLAPVLIQQETALREFEYGDGELRLTLVPVNSELNIEAIIQQLEALPKLSDIRLLPENDARILRISAKISPMDSMDGGTAGLPAPQINAAAANGNVKPGDKEAASGSLTPENKERSR
ncbi:MAG: hypothetical protein Q8N54_15160 [Sulfurimicrobium sp.]|nr:hypothetical protein [Sulfurimicrobium sp.]